MTKIHAPALLTGLLLLGVLPAAAAETAEPAKAVTVTPEAIPGAPRDRNNAPTGGYAPSQMLTQFNIDVNSDTQVLNVIRDNTDPYVVTKPYVLKHADPYALRSYLEAAIRATSISESPVQVMALKYRDRKSVV